MPVSSSLSFLLATYAAIILINCVVSSALWWHHRDEYHRETMKLWLAALVAFLVQGIFLKKDIWTVLAFCTSFACSFQLVRLLSLAVDIRFPERAYQKGMAAAVGLAVLASSLKLSLFWMAIFPASGIAFPIFHSTYLTVRKRGWRGSGMLQVFLALLTFYALHFMDYPFLRHADSNAFFGFTVTLVLIFCLSIFLPSYNIANAGARYARQLEQEVLRRTESLRAANEELKTLSEEHDHLLRLVVHDVANPLSMVKYNVEELRKARQGEDKGPSFQALIDKIQLATDTMIEVLKNVKYLHSLRTGKLRLNLGPVPIIEALRQQLLMFERQLAQKRVKVRIEQKVEASPTILAEPTSLKNHVLANLISNAIKYSEPGGEIVLSVEDAGDNIQVTVADRGIGIPASLIPELFDLKKPTSRPGTRGEKGTGFGMPIVKTYLDRYGAQIQVRSAEKSVAHSEHGTEFQIQFKKAA